MFYHVVTGKYHFREKKVGLKRDFCNHCRTECVAELWHGFEIMHAYWVPIFPMGWRNRWKCARCGKDPHGKYGTTKSTLYVGAIFFFCGALILLMVPTDADDAWFFWALRIVFGLAAAWMLIAGVRQKPFPEKARRAAVAPLREVDPCPQCREPLEGEPYLHCARCRVLVY